MMSKRQKKLNKELCELAWSLHPDIEQIKELIANGADVNARTPAKLVPLTMVHDVAVAKILIENGADVNIQDFTGATPLFMSMGPDIAKLLLDSARRRFREGYWCDVCKGWRSVSV